MWHLSRRIIFIVTLATAAPLATTDTHAQNQNANAHVRPRQHVSGQQVLSLFPTNVRIAAKVLPKSFAMDGAINEWISLGESSAHLFAVSPVRRDLFAVSPVRRDLIATDTSQKAAGRLWIAQSAAGIVVAGSMDVGNTSDFSLDLSIASLKEITLPPISWGYRTPAPGYYTRAADCATMTPNDAGYSIADCKQWFNAQVSHRAQIAAAFVRRFVLRDRTSAAVAARSGATSTDSVFELPRSLEIPDFQPHVPVSIAFKSGEASVESDSAPRSFELLIPWDALPATDQLRLASVYLSIAVNATPFIDAKPPQQPFFAVALTTPREFAVTRCHTPLVAVDNGQTSAGYFLPSAGTATGRVVAFFGESPAYPDSPEGINSQAALATLHEDTELAPGQFLCWPLLAYQQHSDKPLTLMPLDDWSGQPVLLLHPQDGSNSYTVTASPNWAGAVQWRTIDGNNLLLRQGSDIKDFEGNGAGACGGCPYTNLNFWYLNRAAGTFKQIFSAADEISRQGVMPGTYLPPTITVSTDWRTLTVAPFEAFDELQKLSYCLTAGEGRYQHCDAE